jgi:two-component system, chemotaxis family, chemotaxis protein CheY
MRTLVVDDDPNIRGIVRRVLTRRFDALDIVECEDGLAALELLSKGEYDFVLLDVSMPLMDGLDVLQSVRRAPVIAKIPVIMMTGNNDEHTIRQAMKLGVNDFILKPIHPTQLCERVLKILTHSSGNGERKGPTRHAFRPLSLTPGTSVLLADGSAEFREFFHKTVSSLCTVHTSSSGLAAFQHCLDQPPYALFVGSELGLITGEVLVRKLRALPRLCAVRLVGIETERNLLQVRKRGIYEAVIIRSFVHEVFKEGMESLLRAPVSKAADLPGVPDLKLLAISAAEESLSGSIGKHVALRPASNRLMQASAAVTLRVGADNLPLTVRLSTPANGVERLAANAAQRLLIDDATPDTAMVTLVGRLGDSLADELRGRNLSVTCEAPTVTRQPPRRPANSTDDHGVCLEFDVPNDKLSLRVTLAVGANGKAAA